MEHKYNQLNLERYSNSLAKLLCDRYFGSAPTVNGQQLINFTPIKQVNLFMIKELLLRWNQEMANLKSPYFDFENDEVKEALVQFMNVLSRKILMQRAPFEPLLAKAITDTFRWALEPAIVFEEKFLKAQDSITTAKLQSNFKYINLNKNLVQDFLDSQGTGPLHYAAVLNDFKAFLAAHKQAWTSADEIVATFNNLLAIRTTDLLEQRVVPAPATIPAPKAESAPPVASQPPVPGPSPVNTIPTPKPLTTDNNLNEKFRADKPTLNEKLAKPAPTLADNQMGKKIESLKDSISINQRFSFINELFNGENLQYYNVIKTLDEFKDAESAKSYVLQDVGSKHDWSKKEDHVNKLLRLIERKFA